MLAARTAPSEWLHTIEAEFFEMPSLQLTKTQMERLWGLDPMTCERLLSELIDSGFLRRTSRGSYVRNRNEVG